MKIWAIFNRQFKLLGYRKMTKYDVFSYFKLLEKGSRGEIGGYTKYDKRIHFMRKKGEYCERCSIGLGERYINKDRFEWNGFYLCGSCYDDKLLNKQATPDLEDLMKII